MGGAAAAEYETAIKKLFPQGDYWDRQFADPESDVSLFCKAKLPELIKFRRRMETLQNESFVNTTEELIADWERVLLDSVFPKLSLLQRRLQLNLMWTIRLNRAELQKIADMYELTIADVYFPYRSGFFGFSRFSNSYIGSPVVFSVLFLIVRQENFREKSWALIKPDYPAKRFGRMRFGIDRLVCFPIDQLRLYVCEKLRESAFGFAKCGRSRIFPMDIRLNAEELEAKRFGRMRLGIDRLIYFPFHRLRLLTSGFNLEKFAQSIRFFYRFENVLINHMLKEKQPFKDFELAITSILLANQLPYFFYKESTI
jgi:hypothetical protein